MQPNAFPDKLQQTSHNIDGIILLQVNLNKPALIFATSKILLFETSKTSQLLQRLAKTNLKKFCY